METNKKNTTQERNKKNKYPNDNKRRKDKNKEKDEIEIDINNNYNKKNKNNKVDIKLLNKKTYKKVIKENSEKKDENDSENNSESDEIKESEEKSDKNEEKSSENEFENDEDVEDVEGEENNDDESGEDGLIVNLCKGLKGKEKWYCKKKNVPKPKYELDKNNLPEKLNEQVNSEVVTMLHFQEKFRSPYDNNYLDIKELSNGYYFILFDNIFYCISSKKFRVLNNNESLKKYFEKENILFSDFQQINDELIGIISSKFLLIVKYNKNELSFFQEISIEPSIIKSFPSENLIIITEYVHEKEKDVNILNYYAYDEKKSQFQFQKKEEIDFSKFGEEIKQFCCYFNLIGNIKKLKNGKFLFFTISTILFEEKQNFALFVGSFYERDCDIFLNIYSYENKELSLIYKFNYSQHYVYNSIENKYYFNNTLKFWNDRNLRLNEENKEINFFIQYLSRDIKVNYETKERKRKQFEESELTMNYIYDDKSKLYFIERNNDTDEQMISIFDSNREYIKNIFLPFYFSDIIYLKKGYLLGVIRNTLTVYSFYHHLGRYAPSKSVQTNLCLIKYSI